MERKKCPFRTVAAKTFASTQIYVVHLLYIVPHFPRKFLSQESLIDQVLRYTFLFSSYYVVEAPFSQSHAAYRVSQMFKSEKEMSHLILECLFPS